MDENNEIVKDVREVLAKKPSPSGSPYLDRVREAVTKTYTAEYVSNKVGDLMEAFDEKQGRDGMTIRTPNWRAREAGLKVLLQISGLDNKEQQAASSVPTKITVIVNGQDQSVKVKAEGDKKTEILDVKPND